METQTTLTDETVDALQDLVRVSIDSAKGLKTAADTIESPEIARFMRSLADQRQANAAELRRHVQMNNEEAEDSGSIKGSFHRWWLNARGALNGGDDYVVLIEAERGEDEIKERYEDALKSVPGSAMEPVLRKQYENVKASHDTIRDMRDAKKS